MSRVLLFTLVASLFAQYPPARRSDVVENLHGVKITDPYRWMEDVDSPETRAWVNAEVAYTNEWFKKIPGRTELAKQLLEWTDVPTATIMNNRPVRSGNRLVYAETKPGQNQPILYVRNNEYAQPRVLIDPNSMSNDGTVALSTWSLTRTGSRVAYGVSTAGSDWMEVRVRDVETGRDMMDSLRWMKFSNISWTQEEDGFFYSRFPEPKSTEQLTSENTNQKVYFHKIGTAQTEDRLVYERPDQPRWRFTPYLAADGRFLLISTSEGGRENLLTIMDRKAETPQFRVIVDRFEAQFEYLGSRGNLAYFHTDDRAPKGRIIAIDLEHPDRSFWKEIVPPAENAIEEATLAGGFAVCVYSKDVASELRLFPLDGGKAREVAVPPLGAVSVARGSQSDRDLFYAFASFTEPSVLYRYDFERGISELFTQRKLPFDPKQFSVTRVFYLSKDGTKIPMFLIQKAGAPEGPKRTLLYGYGGFNISQQPAYRAADLLWVTRGGTMTIAALRGGGEYGREWHRAGMRERKQNVFDDFIAAAEYLIQNKYTTPKLLGIKGGSNGGLLVGAVLNQRPDLFGAAVPQVGVMDMLRFHKFTVGAGWTSDFGNPDKAEDFAYISKYSPIHNIRKGTEYPPTLITTADHDDRVVPAHSFKYAAAMQAAQEGKNPILVRIETSAGHGAGKPLSKRVEEGADILAFLEWTLKESAP